MSRDVQIANTNQSIRDVARIMSELHAGFMPVQDKDRLVGTITDRDITVRAVAAGKGPDTSVREVMTRDVKYCFEDEDLDHVAHNMGDQRVRRLPVMNRQKRLVGVISLGDVARTKTGATGDAISGVSQAGGPHGT
jgi:CBS domain-containing protein